MCLSDSTTSIVDLRTEHEDRPGLTAADADADAWRCNGVGADILLTMRVVDDFSVKLRVQTSSRGMR